MGFLEQLLVVDVLPDDEALDDAVQALALGLLRFLGRELSGCADGSSTSWANSTARAGGERAARPPQVQRRRVAVADRLLARGLAVDVLQRERDLDELRLVPAICCSLIPVPSPFPLFAQLPMMPVAAKSPKSTSRNGSTM